MDATLEDVAKKTRREPTAEEKVAEELIRRARGLRDRSRATPGGRAQSPARICAAWPCSGPLPALHSGALRFLARGRSAKRSTICARLVACLSRLEPFRA
jgi:hypothetical protein